DFLGCFYIRSGFGSRGPRRGRPRLYGFEFTRQNSREHCSLQKRMPRLVLSPHCLHVRFAGPIFAIKPRPLWLASDLLLVKGRGMEREQKIRLVSRFATAVFVIISAYWIWHLFFTR